MLLQQSAPSSEGVFASGGNVFKEFPMWVTHENGEQRVVESEEQLAALGGGWIRPERVDPVPADQKPEFQHYPKWVGSVLVNSAEEESALAPVEPESDERKMMIQIAEEKGVKIDKRWSADKIRAALEAA
jgi:hypothetical protein